MTTRTHSINERLRGAIIYILSTWKDVPDMGLKKLSKLLYFSDFNYYKKHYKSITGESYTRMPYGPLPKTIYSVLERMKEEGIIHAEQKQHDDYVMWDMKLLKNVDVPLLSDEEKKEIDTVMSKLGKLNGRQLQDLSHKDTPWFVSDSNEEINYKLVFYRTEEIEKAVE